MRTARAPSDCQNPSMAETTSGRDALVGVTTTTRPANNSAVAASGPFCSLPASGWLPTKGMQLEKRSASAASACITIPDFVLPASVIRQPSGQCLPASPICPATDSTGVQMTIRSARSTPLATLVVTSVTQPRSSAFSSDSFLRPIPTTRLASFRWRKANPTEPPISPTPTITTVSHVRMSYHLERRADSSKTDNSVLPAMREITSHTAADYLYSTGRVEKGETVEVRELPGGVSNLVLLVTLPHSGQQFVLKQARGRLRVKDEWLCPVERIWREVEVLQICGDLLKSQNDAPIEAGVPRVLWEDRDNYCYAMTAAPEAHKTWKELLLAGNLDEPLAAACGQMLGQLHSASWRNDEIAARLDDRSYFDQLRIDPYYRHIARVHPNLALDVQRLIDSVWQHRLCLVHGDYSPKNLLVWPAHVTLIDFEVGHFGDPAFDLGFFLTHLVLKSIWAGERRPEFVTLANEFWTTYRATLCSTVATDELTSLEQRMLWNLA